MAVKWNGGRVNQQVFMAAARGVVRGTEAVRNEAIRLILETPKTGRMYGDHRASAPGEPPASDTGTHVRNIRTDFSDLDRLTGRAVASAEHSAHLEYGTESMEPRPHMRPALANSRGEINAVIASEIRRALA